MKPSLDSATSQSIQHSIYQNRPQQSAINESYRSQDQGVSISLKTEEGDTITISQRSASSQYRSESMTTDSYRLVERSVSANSMQISVKGDLNQEELYDLAQLLEDLNGIASDFFDGNLADAVTGAMNLGDMGTISHLEATFTRTSILSNYLQAPHPIPSLGQGTEALMASDESLKNSLQPDHPPQPEIVDILAAQWQQFLDDLKPKPSAAAPSAEKATAPTSSNQTAKEMFERAKETLANNPRLTPLLPSVAELAINRAARRYHPNESAAQMAQSTAKAFNTLFSDWVI